METMKKSRKNLHDILCRILGSTNCYFSPPASIELKYPCIVYHFSNVDQQFADDRSYRNTRRWTVTIMDKDPESEIPDRMLELPYCSSDRNFVSEGINHFVFTLFY